MSSQPLRPPDRFPTIDVAPAVISRRDSKVEHLDQRSWAATVPTSREIPTLLHWFNIPRLLRPTTIPCCNTRGASARLKSLSKPMSDISNGEGERPGCCVGSQREQYV